MANLIFDIDGTLRNFETEPQFDPELQKYLLISQKRHKNHIVSGRTYSNIQSLFKEMDLAEDVFQSISCEDGHICYYNKARRILLNLDELLQLERAKKLAKLSLKKFPSVSLPDPNLISEVALVLQMKEKRLGFVEHLSAQIIKHNLDKIKVVELTHNRVLIAAKAANKCTAVLSSNIKLADSYYFCDEKNDLELASKINENKGRVICPSNAIPELKKIATYVAQKPYSFGVVEFLRQIL